MVIVYLVNGVSMKHVTFKITGDVSDNQLIGRLLLSACDSAGAHVLRAVDHRFDPVGYTMVVLLSESHASLHSWPEHEFALVDYFSCATDPRIEDFVDFWFRCGFGITDDQILDR